VPALRRMVPRQRRSDQGRGLTRAPTTCSTASSRCIHRAGDHRRGVATAEYDIEARELRRTDTGAVLVGGDAGSLFPDLFVPRRPYRRRFRRARRRKREIAAFLKATLRLPWVRDAAHP